MDRVVSADVYKVALVFGPLTIHWYGVLVAVGFLLGLWTASRRGLHDNLDPEKLVDFGPWVLGAAIVGSRLLFVIMEWRNYFSQQPWWEIFMIQKGGLVYYGGLIGASLATVFYMRWKKLPLWRMADALAPSIALGQMFGRLGCLMNGCCYGRPSDLPWAICFPKDHETHGLPVHPTEIYESLLNLALYLALAALYRRKKFTGQVFASYLICYALLRSFVEMFRGDYAEYYGGGWITPAHLVSVGIFSAGTYLYWKFSRTASQPVKDA